MPDDPARRDESVIISGRFEQSSGITTGSIALTDARQPQCRIAQPRGECGSLCRSLRKNRFCVLKTKIGFIPHEIFARKGGVWTA
jgi:hypothetical protein